MSPSRLVSASRKNKKESLTSYVTGPDDGVASPMPFEGSPMLHSLRLNSVARSGARGVRVLKMLYRASALTIRSGLILLLLSGTGCASAWSHSEPPNQWYEEIYGGKQPFPIEYNYRDIPNERKIELTFTNGRKLAVCLYPGHWPNSEVAIDSFPNPIALLVAGNRFEFKRGNTEYCPGGCCLLVEPGKTVRAYLLYDGFKVPDDLVNEPKELEFKPKAWYCRLRQ